MRSACRTLDPATAVDTYDLHATVLNQLGLDHLKVTFLNQGRSERPTVVYGRGGQGTACVKHRLFAALACLVAASAAAAQGSAPLSALQVGQAIEARKAVYVLTARNLAPLAAMTQGKLAFNATDALKRARRLELLADIGHEWYPAGSLGAESRATPRVWRNGRGLRATDCVSCRRCPGRSSRPFSTIQRVARSFAPAVSRVSAACKGCHERSRKD